MTGALADAVAAVAAEAGQMALARWRTDFRRWEKEPGSPVCEVDLDVDRMHRAYGKYLLAGGHLSALAQR